MLGQALRHLNERGLRQILKFGALPNEPFVVDPRFPALSSPTQNALLPSTVAVVTDRANDPAVATAVDAPLDFTVEGDTVAPDVLTTQYTVPASSVEPVMDAVEPL